MKKDEILSIIEDEIKKISINIDESNIDILKKIACISTNNDSIAGDLIFNVFKEIGNYGMVNIEHGNTANDSYIITSGIEFKRGYIDREMANNPDKVTCEYENVKVFMCNDVLSDEDMEMISQLAMKYCVDKDIPLMIVAKNFSPSMKAFFHANKLKNKKLPIVAMDMGMSGVNALDRFDDLAIILGCVPYDKYYGEKLENGFSDERIGSCKKIICNENITRFIKGEGDKEMIKGRANILISEYEKTYKIEDHIDRTESLYDLQRRIASLKSSMAIIYVGGNSEAERETRRFLIEDAVYACQSAIKSGYVVGGNLVLPRILSDINIYHEIVMKLENSLKYLNNKEGNPNFVQNFVSDLLAYIDNAFKHSFSTVLKNGHINDKEIDLILFKCIKSNCFYNLKLREYESNNMTTVINSAETDIEIIKATFSIIGLLATSNQFISVNTMLESR